MDNVLFTHPDVKRVISGYLGLSLNERINFKSWFLNVACYGCNHAWYKLFNEVYYGPTFYGSAPYAIAWDNETTYIKHSNGQR